MDPLLLVGLIALLGAAVWLTIVTRATVLAKREYRTVTTLDPEQALRRIEASFRPGRWRHVDGPGRLNRQRRWWSLSLERGAVIAVDALPLPDGTTLVVSWVAEAQAFGGALVTSHGVGKPRQVVALVESWLGPSPRPRT